MSRLKNLLQDADPLRHEPQSLDGERERIRRTILDTAPVRRPTGPLRVRVPVAVTFAVAAIGVVALSYVLWVHGTTPVQAAVRFEVRLAEDRAVPGLVVAQLPDSGRLIYLHPEIVVSNDDIAQSSVVDDGAGRFGVEVQFLAAGAERMRQATGAHVGRPVAILIDGDVVMAPVVRAPILESATITGNFTRADAQRIAEGIGR
jgi:SecD-like export protein